MALLVVLALLAAIPAAIARSRGRSFTGWWIYAFFLLPIAAIHVIATERRPTPMAPVLREPPMLITPVTRSARRPTPAPVVVDRIIESTPAPPARASKKTGVTLAPGEVLLGQNLARPVVIDYADARTNQTRRLILVHKAIGMHGPNGVELAKLYATCSLRKAMRSFRVDRIRSAADPDTGEVVTDLRRFLLG